MIRKLGLTRILLLAAIALLVLSVALGVASLFPVSAGTKQSSVIIDNSLNLSVNETYRQGLGSFYGGENITLQVTSPTVFLKNFTLITYNGVRISNRTTEDLTLNFTAGADYYEAVFCNSTNSGQINFKVTVQQPKLLYPLSALTAPAKTLFVVSLALSMVAVLQLAVSKQKLLSSAPANLSLGRIGQKRLLALVAVSLVVWLSLLAVNSNTLSSFENWYTDHARDPYVANLFLKDGFSVFNTPLGTLSNQDSSSYKFVTWPEMPHLYPLGSILLFLPFGALAQSGVDASLVYKLEIALFLVFAHACLFLFLNRFWKKDMHLFLKLVGIYIIYVSLVIYAADGMFDSVAFLFSLVALPMFLVERYDYFFLLVGASIFLKYQAGIFLLPLILFSVAMLVEKNRWSLLRNKAFVAGAVLMLVSAFTAYLSMPFLTQTKPQFIFNGVNAFTSNSQVPWLLQTPAVVLTLSVTLIFVFYMLNRNSLLSLSALFLLLPSFTLPYFQNWYLPFLFVYVLVPQDKKQLEATILWLVFMIAVLSFGAVAFSPLQIFENFRSLKL